MGDTTALATIAPQQLAAPVPDRGPPPRPPRARANIVSMPSGLFDRWGQNRHPGRGLTVARILQIYAAAERGQPMQQCDLFDDVIERDAHLRSLRESRIGAVAGKEWIVQAGGDAPEDVEAAQLLETALRKVRNMREVIAHHADMIFYGYALTEIGWDIDPDTGLIAPLWFEPIAPRRVVFDGWGTPRLLVDSAWEGVELEPGRWLWSSLGRYPATKGIMRSATFPAHFKSLATRDMVLSSERYGLPFPIATYGDATPEEEKAALVEAVAAVGRDGYAAFHESCKIDNLDVKMDGVASVHLAAIGYYNQEESKLILGATLTTGEGSSTGSYALGTVHENRSFERTQGDAQAIGDLYENQIGARFVAWNGLAAKAPRLKLHVVRESLPAERMDLYCRAVNELGLKVDADQAYQEFQLKPADDEDAMGADDPEDGGEDPGDEDPDAPDDEEPFDDEEEIAAAADGGELAFNPNQPRGPDGRFIPAGGGGRKKAKPIPGKRGGEERSARGGGRREPAPKRQPAKRTTTTRRRAKGSDEDKETEAKPERKPRETKATKADKERAAREKTKADREAKREAARQKREAARQEREKKRTERDAARKERDAAKEKAKQERAQKRKEREERLKKLDEKIARQKQEIEERDRKRRDEATDAFKADKSPEERDRIDRSVKRSETLNKAADDISAGFDPTPDRQRVVREDLRDRLKTYGMESRDGGRVNADSYRIGASDGMAHHDWTGEVVGSEKYREQFGRATKLLGAKPPPPEPVLMRDGMTDHDAVRTLLHEEIHGHSPMGPFAYRGAGAKIEEVTTELAAQHVSKEMGFKTSFASYREDIADVVITMQIYQRRPSSDIMRDLTAASIDMRKARPGVINNPDDYVEHFMASLRRTDTSGSSDATFRNIHNELRRMQIVSGKR